MEFSPEEIETCLKVLHYCANFPGSLRRDERFKSLIAKLYKETRRDENRDERWRKLTEDRAVRAETEMVRIQRDPYGSSPPQPAIAAKDAQPAADAPPGRTLNEPENCYICKTEYSEVHFFYHLLCPACAEFNYRMRHLHADLTGRTALVTGGRVKIGFQTVLRLLRDGAKVIVTTRFPTPPPAASTPKPICRVGGPPAPVWPRPAQHSGGRSGSPAICSTPKLIWIL